MVKGFLAFLTVVFWSGLGIFEHAAAFEIDPKSKAVREAVCKQKTEQKPQKKQANRFCMTQGLIELAKRRAKKDHKHLAFIDGAFLVKTDKWPIKGDGSLFKGEASNLLVQGYNQLLRQAVCHEYSPAISALFAYEQPPALWRLPPQEAFYLAQYAVVKKIGLQDAKDKRDRVWHAISNSQRREILTFFKTIEERLPRLFLNYRCFPPIYAGVVEAYKRGRGKDGRGKID